MSLEAPGFIKDLIPTNPEGTDPKSQGDDHLRLIKQCLQTQFPGFLEGKPITLNETQLQAMAGPSGRMGPVNINTSIPYSCVIPWVGGSTGTTPPSPVAGDVILNLCLDLNNITQYWYTRATNMLWVRWWATTAWQPWICQSSIGTGQAWGNYTGSRAIGATYTNTTGRPIYVSVIAAASSAASFVTLYSNGVQIAGGTSPNSLTAVTVAGIIPVAGTYQANGNAPLNLSVWSELR